MHTLRRGQPPGWTGYRRRIDRVMLADLAWPPSARPRAFVCGPTSLVASVASLLVDLGHDPAHVKTERFGQSGVDDTVVAYPSGERAVQEQAGVTG